MSNENDRIARLIAKATEGHGAVVAETIRDAYRAGFSDGIWHVARTARQALNHDAIFAASMVSSENPFAAQPKPEPTAKRAPYGLCRRAITEALRVAGREGINIDIVIETGFRMEGGPKLAASSVRSTLIDMRKAGEIEQRGARWYRVLRPENETAGNAHEANPAASFIHNQGGHNGAALVN